MRWARMGLLWIVLAVLAVRDPAGLTSAGFAPYWLLLPALAAGLRASPGYAVFLGWASGLVADLMSMEPFGLHALAYGAAALVLTRIRQHLFSDHPLTQGVLAFALALLTGVVLLLRLEIAEPAFRIGPQLPPAFLASLTTAALLPLLLLADRPARLFTGFGDRRLRV